MYSGKILVDFRKKFNLSQETLAEILDTSRQRISRMENDLVDIGFSDIRKLCSLYDNYFIKQLSRNIIGCDTYLSITDCFIDYNIDLVTKVSTANIAMIKLYSFLLDNVTKVSKK